MDIDVIIGISVLTCSLGLLLYLTWWARGRINKIEEKGPGTARELLKDDDRK